MKDLTRTTRLAAFALALMAIPLAVAQSGPPPGYTDPLVYAQDYAASQADQAAADPLSFAANKTSPEGLANETEHAAWLACWTAHDQGLPLEAACSQFFIPPGVVDAPAEAEAEITQTVNATDALADEVLDAVGDTVDDPTSALQQVDRIVAAVQTFLGAVVSGVQDLLNGMLDIVLAIVDAILDVAGLGRTASLAGLDALADGLLAVLGLPALGLMAAADGISAAVTGTVDGIAAAGVGAAAAVQAVADGLAAAALATASAPGAGVDGVAAGLTSVSSAVVDAGSAATEAVGSAADAIAETVADAADAVGQTISGWFGADRASGSGAGGVVDRDGIKTGTEADGLIDRVLGLL